MPKKYPEHKIDEALLAYYTLGTREQAEAATGIPGKTIYHWAHTSHVERYDELAHRHGPTLERQAVSKLARSQGKAIDRADKALDAMGTLLDAGEYKDANIASSAAKNAALVVGIFTDKKLTLEGRPSVITEHRDTDDILKSLNSIMPGLVVNGTAEDITTQPSLSKAQSQAGDAVHSASQRHTDANAREQQAA